VGIQALECLATVDLAVILVQLVHQVILDFQDTVDQAFLDILVLVVSADILDTQAAVFLGIVVLVDILAQLASLVHQAILDIQASVDILDLDILD